MSDIFSTVKRQPWEHQRRAVEVAKDLDHYALYFEVGTGKTFTSIMLARSWMKQAGRALRTLVFAPPIVLNNWKSEWEQFSKISADRIMVIYGPGKKRRELFDDNNPMVAITNYESLQMQPVVDAIKAWAPEVIIFDEMHRLKNPQSKRAKKAKDIAAIATKKIGATGTPILKNPMDLFMQWRLLDGGEALGDNFYEFRAKYFYDRNARMPTHAYFPDWQIKKGALDAIMDRIKPYAMFAEKSKCLDLPPFVRVAIEVEMSTEQKRMYDEMVRDFVTYTRSGLVVAKMAMTKLIRLQQIVSGFVPIDGEEEGRVHFIENVPRLDALSELLSEHAENSKVIIWAAYRPNYTQISALCKRLNYEAVEVHGLKSKTEKDQAVKLFNEDPKVRVLIGHPGSGGIGVNLVSSNLSIVYSRTENFEHDVQSEGRNYRGGSEIHDKVTRIDLIAKDTVDEKIAAAVAAKQTISDKFLMNLALELERTL